MNSKVFISGSIAIKSLPQCIKESIQKIIEQGFEIFVGDADGIDSLVQKYIAAQNYSNVTVYSIYPMPRFKLEQFNKKHIEPQIVSKKERELQTEKDAAMTLDSDFSLIIWDGKSKGSYKNILRALENDKKIRVYLSTEDTYLKPEKVTPQETEYIYRENNGYTAAEVVKYLHSQSEEFFKDTRQFNKLMIEHNVIAKDDKIYVAKELDKSLYMLDKYHGKVKGIKFKNAFIDWIETWVKEHKQPQTDSLF